MVDYPGADNGPDYNSMIANFKITLKVRNIHIKYDIHKLNQSNNKEYMSLELEGICNEKILETKMNRIIYGITSRKISKMLAGWSGPTRTSQG